VTTHNCFQRAFPGPHTGSGRRTHNNLCPRIQWYGAEPLTDKCADHACMWRGWTGWHWGAL